MAAQAQRTIKQIVNDYATALYRTGKINREEFEKHTTTKDGQSEILEILLSKLYETEEVNGQLVSSMDAFYHFCEFIVHRDPASGLKIWNSFVHDLFRDIEYHQLSSIMAPRGHGKSYMAYVLYPIFKAFLFPYVDAVLVSNIPKMNERNFRVLKRVIEANELLSEKIDYTGKEKTKWTESEIAYNHGYIEGISIGSSPRSAHVKFVVGDDPLRDDARYSDEYYKNFFLGQLLPTIQRYKGRMVLLGTPQHFEDLFHTVMNTKVEGEEAIPRPVGQLITDGRISHLGFYSRVYKAYDEETGKVLLPEVFSMDQLDKIRRTQGEIYFQREYMCECVADKTAIFPYKLIKKCMENEEKIEDFGKEGKEYFIGVDVATSGSASADYSAFIVLEAKPERIKSTDDEGKVREEEVVIKIIKHIYHIKGLSIEEQIDKVIELAKRFNDAYVLVEQNNVGVALIQRLQYSGVNVGTFVTSKFKKDNIIRLLVNDMQNGRFKIPKTGSEVLKLKDELTKFGVKLSHTRTGGTKENMQALSGHDDLVMATAIANNAVEDYGSGSTSIICQN